MEINVENIFALSEPFREYANSLNSGYLKSWKASGMLYTLSKIPNIINDEARFLSYLKNCLEMEGFNQTHVELIMGWLYERLR